MSMSQSKRRADQHDTQSWVTGGIAVAALLGVAFWIRKGQINQIQQPIIKQSTRTASQSVNHMNNQSSYQPNQTENPSSRNFNQESSSSSNQSNQQSTHHSNNQSQNQPNNQSNNASSNQQQSQRHADDFNHRSSNSNNHSESSEKFDQTTDQSDNQSNDQSSNQSNNQWFNFHEAELNRLREEQEWQQMARQTAMKNADWFIIRSRKKKPHYSKWSGSKKKVGDESDEEPLNHQSNDSTFRSSSEQSYWQWKSFNDHKHDPYARYRKGHQSNNQSNDQATNQLKLIDLAKKELGLSDSQSNDRSSKQPAKAPISPSFGQQSIHPSISQALNNLSINQVKKAFRERAFDTHPDLNGGDDSKFKRVADAYNLLMSHMNKK